MIFVSGRLLLGISASHCPIGQSNSSEKTGETKPANLKHEKFFQKLAFSGIQVLSPAVLKLMETLEPKFPIMDFYLSNASTQTISGFVPDNYSMLDVGKLDVLDEAERFVTSNV